VDVGAVMTTSPDTQEWTMASDPTRPWSSQLQAMDEAIGGRNTTIAVRAWSRAYEAALGAPGWRGIIEVAMAALRLGTIPGFRRAATVRAREAYWTALFRARQQGELGGVLHAAGAFGALGDPAMVEHCIRIAEGLAERNGAAASGDWVRVLAADLAHRYASAGQADSE